MNVHLPTLLLLVLAMWVILTLAAQLIRLRLQLWVDQRVIAALERARPEREERGAGLRLSGLVGWAIFLALLVWLLWSLG